MFTPEHQVDGIEHAIGIEIALIVTHLGAVLRFASNAQYANAVVSRQHAADAHRVERLHATTVLFEKSGRHIQRLEHLHLLAPAIHPIEQGATDAKKIATEVHGLPDQ